MNARCGLRAIRVGSSLAMTQVDSEDSTFDLTPRPGESNILRFRKPLSRLDPHVSEVEVAHNQDARFANRFAVLGLAADEDEDNRLAMPVSPPPESVVDALEFDMIRGDSDSDEVVNSASAGSDVENVGLEDWGSEVSGEEIPVPEDPVLDMVGVRLVRLFYGQPSRYLWEDSVGVVHHVDQGEGGEQGDAMMPLLFSPWGNMQLSRQCRVVWSRESV